MLTSSAWPHHNLLIMTSVIIGQIIWPQLFSEAKDDVVWIRSGCGFMRITAKQTVVYLNQKTTDKTCSRRSNICNIKNILPHSGYLGRTFSSTENLASLSLQDRPRSGITFAQNHLPIHHNHQPKPLTIQPSNCLSYFYQKAWLKGSEIVLYNQLKKNTLWWRRNFCLSQMKNIKVVQIYSNFGH